MHSSTADGDVDPGVDETADSLRECQTEKQRQEQGQPRVFRLRWTQSARPTSLKMTAIFDLHEDGVSRRLL